ncbi:MAG: polysaccharide biosynthesis/export family protein, partial [Pyrinomonadaceae bacterium]|nr:polysaccharide biosynthesis/export family protein [Pyrinomonadaceae bacterium]
MNTKILALIICFGAFSVQSISAQNDSGATVTTDNTQNQVSDNSSRGYTVGTGDEITVRVIGESNFDGIYTVDENGEIQLASVSDPIFVGCKTEKEIRGQMIKLYSKYLVNPQINVQFSKRTSRPPAVVYGAVVTPQQYDLRRPARLRELLSYSGGVLSEGASGKIQITHTISSSPNFCKDSNEIVAAQAVDPSKTLTASIRYSDLIAGVESANP